MFFGEKISKTRKVISVVFVVLTILLSSFAFYAYQVTQSPNFLVQKTKAKILYIPKGTDFKGLVAILKKEDMANNIVSFAFLAKTMNYQENVKAGAYLIEPNMTNLEVIRKLRAGNQTPLKFTFNYLRTKKDLAERIAKQLPIPANDWLSLLNNPDVAKKYQLDTNTITTLFLPDTYEVYWTNTPEEILDKMYKAYQKFWTKERLDKAAQYNLTPTQVIILASIVQAETAKNDEKQRVAGVYLNRLAKNDLLQADPTVIFAWQDFSIKRVLSKHLKIDSPYNTYKYVGLPPGAINIPEKSSIEAVLNAEKHNFYYFCAKEDFSGYHNFAENLAQHNQNARLYQQALAKKGY
ncbi:MAG: endolytic transglycosylase MltG [Thermonemataceae bacterium]|nr:endolytic transglycosylase MltG [Thermonemataceae bacterium]